MKLDSRKLLLAAVTIAAMAGGALTARWMSSRIPQEVINATVLPAPRSLPEFNLIDHNGAEFTPASIENRWQLLFFGFTHCPDICPTTLQTLNSVQSSLATTLGDAQTPGIIFVSVDPERDTPEQLQRYLGNFGTDIVGVSGPHVELMKLTTPLGIVFQKVWSDDDQYQMDHSAAILILNPDGQFAALSSAPHSVDLLVRDLSIIMDGA